MPIPKINYYHTSIVHENVKLMKKEDAIRICEAAKYTMAPFKGVKMDPAMYKKVQEHVKNEKLNNNNPLELKPFDYD